MRRKGRTPTQRHNQVAAAKVAKKRLMDRLVDWEDNNGPFPVIRKWRDEYEFTIRGFGFRRLGRQITKQDLVRGFAAPDPDQQTPFKEALERPEIREKLEHIKRVTADWTEKDRARFWAAEREEREEMLQMKLNPTKSRLRIKPRLARS